MAQWQAYAYDPSAGGAAVMIMLFLVVTSIHIWQLVRTRAFLTIPAAIGGLFEVVGYIGRAISANQSPNWTTGPYIIQSTLLLVAPALFAATIYMILGRIILLVRGEHHSIFRLNWLTKIFVIGDVLSFFMQSAGAGIMVQSASATNTTREHVIIGGLFVQIAFFCFFLVAAITFQRCIYRLPTLRSESPTIRWRKHLFALYAASFLILIRSLVRFIEYIQGQNGEINGLLGRGRVAAMGRYGVKFEDVTPALS